MVVSAAVDDLGRVIDMEHFVENDVFHNEFRDRWRVERFADDDGLMRRVMVTENAISLSGRPS